MCFEVIGYLLEELRDAKNYAAFKKDVERSNIFIGSLIFIEELAEKVRVHGTACYPCQPHPVASARALAASLTPVCCLLCCICATHVLARPV